MHVFTDGITKINFSNNNLRVVLAQNGSDNIHTEVGTLIIPANRAAGFVKSLAGGLKELEEQIKAKVEQDKNNTQ
jgi:hypothetical protein